MIFQVIYPMIIVRQNNFYSLLQVKIFHIVINVAFFLTSFTYRSIIQHTLDLFFHPEVIQHLDRIQSIHEFRSHHVRDIMDLLIHNDPFSVFFFSNRENKEVREISLVKLNLRTLNPRSRTISMY